MKFISLLLVSLFIFSCGTDKVIQLPEISHSDISEINDVSAAYLFYDETQPDSLELNRKNLISTTNWLVNVDKRLTLKQAIPKIKFLQDKKRNAEMHKNENAKNYFTCNDLSRKNLGFIEFTNIFYHQNKNPLLRTEGKLLKINFFSINDISITTPYETISKLNKANFITVLKKATNKTEKTLICCFKEHLTFQDYITLKSLLLNSNLKNVLIAKDEFIFN
ncbi:hypothetical protein ACFQ1R_14765 [Mariniflexile jejuense]|uniref:Lipoprotein n=1 Tax=Mariniflexile jejuense TaxID=1173582 RepID=A0ABW3JLF8_9FLAO